MQQAVQKYVVSPIVKDALGPEESEISLLVKPIGVRVPSLGDDRYSGHRTFQTSDHADRESKFLELWNEYLLKSTSDPQNDWSCNHTDIVFATQSHVVDTRHFAPLSSHVASGETADTKSAVILSKLAGDSARFVIATYKSNLPNKQKYQITVEQHPVNGGDLEVPPCSVTQVG